MIRFCLLSHLLQIWFICWFVYGMFDWFLFCRFIWFRAKNELDTIASYIYEDVDIWTMNDLVSVRNGSFHKRIDEIIAEGERHVFDCEVRICAHKRFLVSSTLFFQLFSFSFEFFTILYTGHVPNSLIRSKKNNPHFPLYAVFSFVQHMGLYANIVMTNKSFFHGKQK